MTFEEMSLEELNAALTQYEELMESDEENYEMWLDAAEQAQGELDKRYGL